jgi:hypothetical protein
MYLTYYILVAGDHLIAFGCAAVCDVTVFKRSVITALKETTLAPRPLD